GVSDREVLESEVGTIKQVARLRNRQSLCLVYTLAQVPVGKPRLENRISRIGVGIGESGCDVGLRMLCAQHVAVVSRPIKVEQVGIPTGIRLLVVSPIQVMQRVVVHFSNTLEEDAEVKAIPFCAQADPVTHSRCEVADHAEVFGVVDRCTLLNDAVSVEVL